jgi:hypothetical protein
LNTTPAAYGQLTMARFTPEGANRKGAFGDQTTLGLLPGQGFLSRTGKSQLLKSRPEAGAPRGECLDPQRGYRTVV